MKIRAEAVPDQKTIRLVHEFAFETPAEAKLVDSLRELTKPLISLVAEEEGEIVGHILFSAVTLDGQPDLNLMGLGPVAVLPQYQRQGIGSALVRTGLERCRDSGAAAVVVLGHPEFYPRLGFVPASRFGLCSEYPVPDEAFMAIELQRGMLKERDGLVRYAPEFGQL